MLFKKLSTDKKQYQIIKEIDFEELLNLPLASSEEVKYLNQFSFIRTIKLIIKRFLIDKINLFLKKKINYNSQREIENVKAKYDKISGDYIDLFYNDDKNKRIDSAVIKSSTVFNHFENKIYIRGGKSVDPTINIVSQFCNNYDLKSLLEVGAGELTTLFPIVKKTNSLKFVSALDLSLNRLKHGKEFLKKQGMNINQYVACDASNIPYKDNSFDIIFTQECIEQVPLLAKKIIDEMIRVSSKYVVIIEPSYEFSNKITRNRILHKGFPILEKKHYENKKSKIIYRDGLPFTRYELYEELVILEKINKIDGDPVLLHPITKEKIEITEEFAIFGDNKVKLKDGIFDLSDL